MHRLCATFGCIACFVIVVAAAVFCGLVANVVHAAQSTQCISEIGLAGGCTALFTRSCLYIDVRVFDLRTCMFACVWLSCLVLPQLLSYAVSTYMDLVATTSRGAGGKTHLVLWTYEKAVRVHAQHVEPSQVPFAPHTHTTARCSLSGDALEN
jgi:hypothetical protein